MCPATKVKLAQLQESSAEGHMVVEEGKGGGKGGDLTEIEEAQCCVQTVVFNCALEIWASVIYTAELPEPLGCLQLWVVPLIATPPSGGVSSDAPTHANILRDVTNTTVTPSSSVAPLAVSEAPSPAVTCTLPAYYGQLLSSGTSTSDNILIVSCGHCEAHNVVETSKDLY
ncbi:uncharacterized protein LACBIDRAFT_325275 [Laccaria bicolor S238N-H82]|uniref:Predicted protein n=1 Tax=Laccaria bicolor (strain S238N-H82 / ATCC MYA-4686) TaxID=486041 RepID=B0D4E0_LACBS|nr:uncharacterized protein LACBIDRAFT_325275 [Laccaria bicolor S238N-H82]EDR10325.1 predicted protein [Laccaria bicolor S238N-H82]|eukprot:XP_001878775.1 predicted protein [Laccaria bicolor S238N-H82]